MLFRPRSILARKIRIQETQKSMDIGLNNALLAKKSIVFLRRPPTCPTQGLQPYSQAAAPPAARPSRSKTPRPPHRARYRAL